MAHLTLEEFRATRRGPLLDIRAIFGDDDRSEPLPGYEYAGPSCICLDGDKPYLVIFNQEWSGKTLEELEKILYEDFYVSEFGS